MFGLKALLLVLLVSFIGLTGIAQGRSLDDPRLVEWNQHFANEEYQEVLDLLSMDIRSKNAHPLAGDYWLRLLSDQTGSDLEDLLSDAAYAETVAALGDYAKLRSLLARNKLSTALLAFPPEHSILKEYPDAGVKLAEAADSTGNNALADAYRIAALAHDPSNFSAVKTLMWTTLNLERQQRWSEALAKNRAWKGTPLATLLEFRLESTRSGGMWRDDRRSLIQTWLETYPNDAFAWNLLADTNFELNRFEEAISASTQVERTFPTYGDIDAHARALVKLGREDEARAYLRSRLTRYAGPEPLDAIVERRLGRIYRQMGLYASSAAQLRLASAAGSEARQYYFWDLSLLHKQNERLEDQLTAVEHALSFAPDDVNYLKALVEVAIETSDYAKAERALNRLFELYDSPPVSVVTLRADLLKKRGGGSEREWLAQLRDQFSQVADFQERSARAIEGTLRKELIERAALAETAFKLDPSSDRFSFWQETLGDLWRETAPEELGSKMENWLAILSGLYPEIGAIHSQLARYKEIPDTELLAFWQEATITLPDTTSLRLHALSELGEKKLWDEAMTFCTAFIDEGKATGTVSMVTKAPVSCSKSLNSSRLDGHVNRIETSKLLAALEQTRKSGNMLDYHYGRRMYFETTGDKPGAGAAILAEMEISDLDFFYANQLIHSHEAHDGVPSRAQWSYMAKIVREQPYNATALGSFLHYHARWGGSEVVALWAIERARRLGLGDYAEWEAELLGKLGDPKRHYVSRYQTNYAGLGNSDRYVNWYDGSARKAREQESSKFTYRFDDYEAVIEIEKPSGEILVREDSIDLGTAIRVSKGAMTYWYRYDDIGNFTALADQDGELLSLEYGDLNLITRMTTNDVILEFAYNDARKPTMISQPGLGKLKVTYDQDNQVISVNADGEGVGARMALGVTASMNRLLGLVKEIGDSTNSLEFPDFGVGRHLDRRAELEEAYESAIHEARSSSQSNLAFSNATALEAANLLIDYMSSNPSYDASFVPDSLSVLEDIIDEARDEYAPESLQLAAANRIKDWQRLKQAQKPNGVTTLEYLWWKNSLDWLVEKAAQSGNAAYGKALSDIGTQGFSLLEHEQWLPFSDVTVDAFWVRHDLGLLLSRQARDAEFYTGLVRANGDIVIGSSKGMLVFSAGRWNWLSWNAGSQGWKKASWVERMDGRSSVVALAEDEMGSLWIGTRSGLVLISDDYEKPLRVEPLEGLGKSGQQVRDILALGSEVLIATDSGVATLGDEAPSRIGLDGKDVLQLIHAGNGTVLARTKDAVFQIEDGVSTQFIGRQFSSIAYLPSSDEVMATDGGNIFRLKRRAEANVIAQPLQGQSEIATTNGVRGLETVRLPDGDYAVAILTDQGVAYYKDFHLEFSKLPLEDQRTGTVLGPQLVIQGPQAPVFVTKEGVYVFSPGLVKRTSDLFEDLLSMNNHNLVLMASGGSNYYSDGLVMYDTVAETIRDRLPIAATRLVQLTEDEIVANDGGMIVRVDITSGVITNLFRADPHEPGGGWNTNSKVTSIAVTKSGEVWATAGGSLFRHVLATSETTEYCYGLNPEEFPVRSDMLSRVFIAPDDTVWLSASNEAHRTYNGVMLEGGLYYFDGNTFQLNNGSLGSRALVTGITPLTDGSAILGYNHGSVRIRTEGGYMDFIHAGPRFIDDPLAEKGMPASYSALQEKRRLWLARDGAQYDDDSFLIPTVDGLALVYKGDWFMLDRLNQMIPNSARNSQYGGREVRAVETDAYGRIYVATVSGLMIAHPTGGVRELMDTNNLSQDLFAFEETEKLRQVGLEFTETLSPSSREAQVIDELTGIEKIMGELIDTRENASRPVVQSRVKSISPDGASKQPLDLKLTEEKLTELNKRRLRLLAELEEENPGLFQVLQLDPREVAALGDRIDPDAMVVQYVPADNKIIIQLTARDKPTITVEVPVDTQELSRAVNEVHASLAARAGRLNRLRSGPAAGNDQSELVMVSDSNLMIQQLAWLYDILLRPIENQLADYKTIYVAPYSELNRLPFGALVRASDPRIEYAVESFNFSKLTSLYLLSLVFDETTFSGDEVLLVGNPDDTLEHAEAEVLTIQKIMPNSTLLLGGAANLDAVQAEMPRNSILHFATHGYLDSGQPRRSHLLLSNNQRLSVIDISAMELRRVNVAVLSACDTGLGRNGLEYATLARAFAHARVPSTVASLWKVDDEATGELMGYLYDDYSHSNSISEALTRAKREMISSGGASSQPEAWAGLELFGKS